MATPSARLLTFESFANLCSPSASSTSAAASKTLQRVWRSLATAATAAFALSLLLGASVTGQAQTDVQAASPAQAESPTTRVPPPLRSVPTAQYFKNHPAAWRQFLSERNRRAAGSARPSKKKASPAFGGTWQPGTVNTMNPSVEDCNPLLLTDGTVIVSDCGWFGNWYKLTPDITGSYANGTWTQIATMPVINGVQYAPLGNASAVLPDGRVIVMGGEYNWLGNIYSNRDPVWTSLGAIYDPFADTWTPVSPPAGAGWTGTDGVGGGIGDAQSTVLADGTFLLAACCGSPDVDALFDATNLTWTGTGAPNAGDLYQDEQGYTLLPNGNVLTVDIWTGCAPSEGPCNGPNPTNAEQYNPSTGTWSSAGNTMVSLVDPYACGTFEIGPAALRPDGTVVQFGGNTGCTGDADPTGIYDSSTNTWSAGPNVPEVCGSNGTTLCTLADSPAAVLPNGNILFAASGYVGGNVQIPTHFFEFTTSNAINQVADAPDGDSGNTVSDSFNFLVLPNGQILVGLSFYEFLFYTPTGSPDPSWAPVISTSPSNVYPGTTYTISGTQLNGLTQGAYYGDDFQMATNYPIVQITNTATGHVFYGRTFNISNRSIAPGNSSSTDFTVPANIELGPSTLVVIANGIPSTPVSIGIAVPTVGVGSSLNPSVYGQAVSFTATVTGASPTGNVQFNIDGGAFGSPVTLASGSATSGTIATLTPGTHTVTAVYSGDTNNAGGTGTLAGGQVVNQSNVTVTVGTSPSGLLVSVDGGTLQAAPVVVSWTIGSPHTIATNSPQGSGGTQYTWSSWSDGGAISHQVTASANVTGYTASFNTAYLLTTAANPSAGGTVTPPSGTYYAASTVVPLTATPNANYAFSNWTGSVANANSASTTVTMTGPQSVSANFAGAQLRLSHSTLDFGTVYLNNTYHELAVTITNVSTSTVTVSGVSIVPGTADASAYRLVEYCKGQIKPKQVCVVAVDFLADAVGTLTATLDIADNAAGSPQQVSLTANVIDPVAALSPRPLMFGQHAVNSQTTLPVQLTNSGQTNLTIGNIAISGQNEGDFSQSSDCPSTLTPTVSCTIEVTFTPSAKGGRGATLTVSGNMATGKANISISGIGH